MIYKVMDRETNNGVFGEFATRKEAEEFIAESEAQDKAEGFYTDNFYQIVEVEA